jgi:glucose-1-phosphate cytidylyltransferase
LFCGGLGTRLREHSDTVPKALVEIGPRPIIWHLMRYYASFGHKSFYLCLGYKGNLIKDYFLNYNHYRSNDFSLVIGRSDVELLDNDIEDWKITFVETGMHSNLAQRLARVREHVADEEVFLANYSDGLSDLPLDTYLEDFQKSGATAGFVSVRPVSGYHIVESGDDHMVTRVQSVMDSNVWINGGFFALRQEIFDVIEEGEELVEEPFGRLIDQRKLYAWRHTGFWQAMDTYKDWSALDGKYHNGERPWERN